MENFSEKDLASKWMVTFFYEQELRSYYMNGVLNGILNPGIHNANLSLYTVDNYDNPEASDIQKSGIYLHIKKGSTFIFSNSYKINNQAVLEKDLDTIGNYLIKCTALEDISYGIYTWSSTARISEDAKAFLSPGRDSVYYLIAKLDYNPNQGSGSTSYLMPTFSIVKNNRNYKEETSDTSVPIAERQSFFYKSTSTGNGSAEIKKEHETGVSLPDGTKNYFLESLKELHRSWLMVGSIIEDPTINRLSSDSSYISSTTWNTGFSDIWVKNHIFTSRGLPEYRKELSGNLTKKNPDFIIDPKAENLYMDLGSIYSDNIIYQQNNDWNNVNTIGLPSEVTTTNPDYSFKINEEDFQKMYESVVEDNIHFPAEGSDTYKHFLVTDLVYLNTTKKIANTSVDFYDYLTNINSSLLSSSNLPIKGVRWASQVGDYKFFNPNYDSDDQKDSGSSTHKGYSYDTSLLDNKLIVPQDVCAANFNRLKSIISNKNTIPLIIDILRKNNMLDATKGESLIPICIAFRKFKVTYDRSSGKINKPTSIDGFSSENVIHPANILSFFDIQNNSTKANSINFKNDDVYTIIPVID